MFGRGPENLIKMYIFVINILQLPEMSDLRKKNVYTKKIQKKVYIWRLVFFY